MATDFGRVRALFEAALDEPAAARSEFLRRSCGGDEALRGEVEQLLVLDASSSPTARVLDTGADGLLHTCDPLLEVSVGGFRLRSVLGSGGMGTVYLADQLEPPRQVALKVLSLGLGGPEAVARFRFEAELLGRLRHAGIAQIHAAGVQRSGALDLPWFALELVVGARDLVAHAAEHALDLRGRLRLLLQLCDAVGHGHRHGVVHRDLKPQNVLVDAEGRVKVIDFGIARSTHGGPGPATALGHLVGTLAYMSPEQLVGGPVDHRSDIWALGVVAFELIAGRRPFAADGAPPWQVAERLRSTPPLRLTAAVPDAPPDLEAVLAKALRGEPGDRYESVAAFAADLGAVLDSRPVAARPPSLGHRLRLLARRRRGLVLALAALAATIATAVAVLAIQNAALRRQTRQAERVARFAREFLFEADPVRERGIDYTVREALDVAARELDGERFPEPVVEAELRLLVGEAYRSLSAPAAALPQLDRAAGLFRATLGDGAARALQAEISRAGVRCDLGDHAGAEAALADVVRRATAALPADDPVLLQALHEQAFVWRAAGRLQDAERRYRDLAAARERTLGPSASGTVATLHNLGTLLLAMQRPDEAHAVLRDCLDRATAGGEGRLSTWQIADNLAEALRDLGRLDEAIAAHRTAMADCARLLGPDHALTLGCGYHLLKALHRRGDRAEFAALAGELLPRCERTFGPEHRRTMDMLTAVAIARQQAGDATGACADFGRAFATQRRQLGAAHPDTFTAGHNLAAAQLAAGAFADALATGTALVEVLPDATDLLPGVAGCSQLLFAEALAGLGDERADAAAGLALERLQTELPAGHPLRQRAEQLVGRLAAARGGGAGR
ncbi:MAG: serine/threonine protein kinase [Planctomycetes bacterium]|nr:serine/threonine protein kinase [Planctomycetota bacterium]